MRSTITDAMSTKRQDLTRKSNGGGSSSIYYGTDKAAVRRMANGMSRSQKTSAANTASKRSVDSSYAKQSSKADSNRTGKASVASK